MQKESGVHCVQRQSGAGKNKRMHTSTASIVVMPIITDTDIKINDNDLKIERYRASGKGGQHRNVTDSAVRITHVPTGIVAQSCAERNQHRNKDNAMTVLQSRIFDAAQQSKDTELSNERKSQIGRGMRSEKFRTYNFPENRITDTRLKVKVHQLEKILNGEMDLIK